MAEPQGPDQLMAALLPAALELTTAYAAAGEEPALFWDTMRRVVGEAQGSADPTAAVVELLLGLAALSGILVDELAANTGQRRSDVVAGIHSRYLGD